MKLNSKVHKIAKKERLKGAIITKQIRNNEKYCRFLDNRSDVRGIYDDEEGCLLEDDGDEIEALGLNYAGGATRFVVIDDDEKEQYIIKDNYSSEMWWNEEEQNAEYNDYQHNYCEDEIELRKDIIIRYPMLAQVFLPLYRIDGGYVQEKCVNYLNTKECDYADYEEYKDLIRNDKEFMEFIDKHAQESQYFDIEGKFDEINAVWRVLGNNYGWYFDVYKFYGMKVLLQLLEVIDEFNIDDLRDENIGYTVKGNRPVLIDYVGFHEEW